MFLTILRILVYAFNTIFTSPIPDIENFFFFFFPRWATFFLIFSHALPSVRYFCPNPTPLLTNSYAIFTCFLTCHFFQEAPLPLYGSVASHMFCSHYPFLMMHCHGLLIWNSPWLLEQPLPPTGTSLASDRLHTHNSPSIPHVAGCFIGSQQSQRWNMSALQVVILWGRGVGTTFSVMLENSHMGCNFTSSLLCYGSNFEEALINIFFCLKPQ